MYILYMRKILYLQQDTLAMHPKCDIMETRGKMSFIVNTKVQIIRKHKYLQQDTLAMHPKCDIMVLDTKGSSLLSVCRFWRREKA